MINLLVVGSALELLQNKKRPLKTTCRVQGMDLFQRATLIALTDVSAHSRCSSIDGMVGMVGLGSFRQLKNQHGHRQVQAKTRAVEE